MPGPLHGGALFVRPWAPGVGVAGTPQRTEIGSFSEDMVLVGIYVDTGTGAVTSQGKLYLGKSGSGAKYTVIDSLPTLSNFFDPALETRFELGVYLPAGEQCVFEVTHQGTDDLTWLIVLAPPPVTREGVADVMRVVLGERGAEAPAKSPATFSR